jgi:DNA modification methylase
MSQTVKIPNRELVSVAELKVDGLNPNVMTPKQHERLSTSIKKYGFIVPIITNKDLLIADGEQRLTVAQSLNMTQVPVIRLPVEDVDRRLLRQVLNKLRGEHDLTADALEFEKIITAGREEDLKHLLDLTDNGLEKYLREIRLVKDEDFEVPELDKIQTDIKRGDILELGVHRLMCGDATKDIATLMDDTKADVLLTDPPYGINIIKGEKGRIGLSKQYRPIEGDDSPFDPEHLLTYSDVQILFGANYYADKLPSKSGWIVWMKKAEETKSNYFADCELLWTNQDKPARVYSHIWRGNWYRAGARKEELTHMIHPTQKPVGLLSSIIQDYTHNPQTILDPYGGSGSTLIACEQTGRVCYMMEIDPRYCQVIVDRWEAYTGKKMVKNG